jgi:hypothetical protein
MNRRHHLADDYQGRKGDGQPLQAEQGQRQGGKFFIKGLTQGQK